MKLQQFGNTGIALPIIGQGTWDVPESGARLAEAKRSLRRGIELGMTHLDTAEMYGAGAVERILADAIAGIPRESLFVTSKVLPSNASYEGTIAACERSLSRLKLDYLDCYLLHWPSPFPLEDTMRALAELVRDGKTRYVGVSNFDTEDMLEAQRLLGDVPLACNQVLYHLRERGIEHRLLPAARAAGIAIVGYSPFGRSAFPRDAVAPTGVLGKLAAKHSATPRQVMLAALTRGEGLFAIPKASSVPHVEENAAAGDLTLDSEDMRAIDAAFPIGEPRELATL
ncbi:MAG TPA: aldo/keto reductase [Candidatus Baltobacteraceae bacterium]|nr:aldo/keto reductase [Candidatus Baltobacteraceae bacterium]